MEMIQLDDEDVIVDIVDLKDSNVPEVVTRNDDGTYSVFLNARFSFERQQEALRHAMSHIQNHDFEKASAQDAEVEAHDAVPELTDEEIRLKLHAEMMEKRRRRWKRRHKKNAKKLAEYEAFANRMRDEDPGFFYWNQNNLMERW